MHCRVTQLSTDVSEVRAVSIIRAMMMEAARACETSDENYFTRQYIPEDKSENINMVGSSMLKLIFCFMEATHELLCVRQMKFGAAKVHRHTYKFYSDHYFLRRSP
jgi:hypothetical protein